MCVVCAWLGSHTHTYAQFFFPSKGGACTKGKRERAGEAYIRGRESSTAAAAAASIDRAASCEYTTSALAIFTIRRHGHLAIPSRRSYLPSKAVYIHIHTYIDITLSSSIIVLRRCRPPSDVIYRCTYLALLRVIILYFFLYNITRVSVLSSRIQRNKAIQPGVRYYNTLYGSRKKELHNREPIVSRTVAAE